MGTKLDPPGNLDGRHYTTYVAEVRELKRAGHADAAAGLLLRLVDAVERQIACQPKGWGVPPWYYEQLAIIYRQSKLPDLESALLRRYVTQCAKCGEPPIPALIERLRKAQSLDVQATMERQIGEP